MYNPYMSDFEREIVARTVADGVVNWIREKNKDLSEDLTANGFTKEPQHQHRLEPSIRASPLAYRVQQ